jgi:hypothetical protein
VYSALPAVLTGRAVRALYDRVPASGHSYDKGIGFAAT